MASRWFRRLGVVALVFALIAIPGAWLLDRVAGRDVVLILPHSDDSIEVNRAVREKDDSVAEIYGTPVGGDAGAARAPGRPPSTRVLFPREDRLLRPVEEPSLLLLRLDKQAGDNPLQAMTVRYVAKTTAMIAAVAGAVLVALAAALGRNRRSA